MHGKDIEWVKFLMNKKTPRIFAHTLVLYCTTCYIMVDSNALIEFYVCVSRAENYKGKAPMGKRAGKNTHFVFLIRTKMPKSKISLCRKEIQIVKIVKW